MRKVLKFFPAALALISLASCSSDDLFGDAQTELSSKYQLKVGLEATENVEVVGGDVTRAGIINNNGWNSVWQAKDVIRAYDNNLGNYDEFKIADNATTALKATFGLVGETPELDSHIYAVFPGDFVKTLGWGKVGTDKKPILTVDIPATGISFNTNFGDKVAYEGNDYPVAVSYVPTWGQVKEDGGTTAQVGLNYMSALIQVSLKAIPATAQELVIYAPDMPLAGRFEAALDADNLNESCLTPDILQYQYTDFIKVNMTGTGLAGKNGAICIPVIAGDYENIFILAKVGGTYQLLANYGPDYTATSTNEGIFGITTNTTWTSTTPDSWKVGGTGADANKYIPSIRKENTDVATGVHFTLARKKMIIFEKTFSIDATCAYPSDITSALSLYSDADELELNIRNTVPLEVSAANYKVEIPEALAGADITLNIDNGLKEGATAHDLVFEGICKSLTVNIASYKSSADGNPTKGLDFSGVIGDVAVAGSTTGTPIEPATLVAPDAEGLTLTYGKDLTATAITLGDANITVAKGATLALALGSAGNEIKGDVNIIGTASAAIFAKGDVTITGSAANVTTTSGDITLKPATPADYSGTLTTATGKITIDNKNKSVVKVVRTDAGDIELNNGIISDLTLTSVAASKVVNVNSKGKSEISAYNAPTATATVNFNSTWDKTAEAAATATNTIYTASQLAKVADATGAVTLKTNITVVNSGSDKKAWVPVNLAQNFTGTGYTISGLNAPLFDQITTASTITGVTITDAVITDWTGDAGVGLLAKDASANAAITITKTTVAGSIASKNESNALYYAGGVIGKHSGTGKLTFGDNTDANKVTAAVTFTNKGRLFGESGVDVKAGTIGQILGSNISTGEVEISEYCAATGAFDKSNTALKFQNFRKYNASYEIEGYFKGNSNLIGYCSGAANVKIGANTYLSTQSYAGLTYASKTVSGTVYFLNYDTTNDTQLKVRAAIKTALSIGDDDYKQTTSGGVTTETTNNVTWNQQVVVLNTYETATY